MVIAFQNFKAIEKLKTNEEKHRAWLKDYEGLYFSVGKDSKDLIKWQKEKEKYIYSDKIWDSYFMDYSEKKYLYGKDINKIQRHKQRLVIEFDGENVNQYLEEVYNKLKEKGIGFIRSNHGGKCDYLWVEFTKELTSKEAEKFLINIAPEGSEIDRNFCSDNRRLPVLFASHWKYGLQEIPCEYFKGEQIDFDSIEFKQKTIQRKSVDGYKTARVFSRIGQGEVFVEDNPLFYDKNGMWWRWNFDNYKYEIIDEVDILNSVLDKLDVDTVNSKIRTEIINALKQVGRKQIPKDIKNSWIQFRDTIVDINTGEKFKASPEYFVTNSIPYKLHNSNFEQTPTIDRIFEEWVGKDYVKTLYEVLAYCLIPAYPIHRLFCLIGSGMNGKSCFINLLKKFIGNHNCTSTELDTLITSRFEITRLHKKLVCMMGETNFSELEKTSIIKKLTGGDLIGYEYKNKNPFEEHNYAKIIIATNNLPTTTDKTIGFYRRWCIIDFPNQFSEEKDILDDIPEEEYESLALKCTGLLKDLLKKRKFHNEGSVEQRMEKYESKSDFLQKFLDEFTKETIGEFISKAEFHKKFRGWCKENRHREMAENTLGKKMKEKNIETGQKYAQWLYDGKGGQMRVWLDLQWK
jgi:P4 family phage/plasmid primase-like protien